MYSQSTIAIWGVLTFLTASWVYTESVCEAKYGLCDNFLDLTMANSWILYRRVSQYKGISSKPLSSADCRQEVAVTLLWNRITKGRIWSTIFAEQDRYYKTQETCPACLSILTTYLSVGQKQQPQFIYFSFQIIKILFMVITYSQFYSIIFETFSLQRNIQISTPHFETWTTFFRKLSSTDTSNIITLSKWIHETQK